MNEQRIGLIRKVLDERGVEALVLTSPSNRRWATGFTSYAGTSFSGDVAIITHASVELLVAAIHVGWAEGEAPIAAPVVAHAGSFAGSLAGYLSKRGFQKVAIEADFLPYPDSTVLSETFSGEIEYVTGLRDRFRTAKDAEEIASLTEAARITDEVFEQTAATLQAGET